MLVRRDNIDAREGAQVSLLPGAQAKEKTNEG
jgi:hypothetical protein